VSETNQFWFHCGRCGSLFKSQPGDLENRLCGKCGSSPGTGMLEAPATIEPPRPIAASIPEPRPERREHREKRSGKRRKNRHLMLKLVAGWTLVLALIIFGARMIWPDEAPIETPTTADQSGQAEDNGEDQVFIKENAPKIIETFSRFLSATLPEERSQFVLSPVTTASRMARFYGLNTPVSLDPQTLQLEKSTVLKLPTGKVIETLWKTQDGKTLEAVFREQDGEWRLDWDHFARYSDYPWSLFLAGDGEPEGEFRLLARELKVEERKDKARTISLILYAPVFGQPDKTGYKSPEFLVQRDSPEGKLLEAAFKMETEGKTPFGSKLGDLHPNDDTIRVRVKVRRSDADDDRDFEITGVTACHWYSVEASGVETAPDEPLPQDE
jgi:hypothetical protein